MSALDKYINKLPKFNPDLKVMAPENRAFFVFTSSIFLTVVVLLGFLLFAPQEDEKKKILLNELESSSATPSADSKVSEQYGKSIRELNKDNYEKAKKDPSSSSLPIIYHNKPDTDSGNIAECGCTWGEQARTALIAELRNLGIANIGEADALRLGESDIFVRTDGLIVDELNQPYQWQGKPIKTNESGVILFANSGLPASMEEGVTSYLSKEGKFYNDTTAIINLSGHVLSEAGVILLGNGLKANKPGGMSNVGNTDVYITIDKQLATIDGKPVFHSSKPVFKNSENGLQLFYGDDVVWDERSVFQNDDGKLNDRKGTKFSRIGILISYDGIVIDNNSMLTEDLKDFKRFGESDLFKDLSNDLVDSFGAKVQYRGYDVRIGTNGSLISEIGPVKNSSNSDVFIKETGRLSADKPVFLTGTLKDSQGVAYDRYGHLISRAGKLSQLGESIIWHSADRFLATKDGKAVLFNGKDTYQNLSRFIIIKGVDAYGLKTFDESIVRDLLNNEVFLNALGQLVYEDGALVKQSGILSASDGVLINSQGQLIHDAQGLQLVTDENGNPIYYEGKPVFKGPDGRLYDANGNPIFSEDGRALYLNNEGIIVDEDGNVLKDGALSIRNPIEENNGFTVTKDGLVLDKEGKPLMYKGMKVYKGADGHLYDEKGNLILDENGKPLTLDKNGVIVGIDGEPANLVDFYTETAIPNKGLVGQSTNSLKQLGSSGIYRTADGLLVDKSGKPITYKGKRVRVGANGQLFDELGNPILDKNGNPLFMDENGNVVDKDGEVVEGIHFLNGDGQYIGKSGDTPELRRIADSDIYLTRDGLLTDESGRPLLYKGQPVKVGPGGRLMTLDGQYVTDANGNGVFLTADGELKNREGELVKGSPLVDGDGVAIDSKGRRVNNGGKLTPLGNGLFRTADGLLVDRDGKPILIDSKQVFVDEEGNLTDAYGNPVRFEGRRLRLTNTGVLVDAQGNTVKSDGDSVLLSAKGLVKEDGTLINPENKKQAVVNVRPNSQVAKQINNADKMAENSTDKDDSDVKDVDSKNKPDVEQETDQAIYLNVDDLTSREKLRLNQRYEQYYSSMKSKFTEYQSKIDAQPVSQTTTFPELTPTGNSKEDDVQNRTADDLSAKTANANRNVIKKAGTTLYASNKMKVNTDLNTKVVFDLMGLPHDHPLYHATAHGSVKLIYDNIVVAFTQICPVNKPCFAIDGIAVDPTTKEASIKGNIDKHYWYRFGGIALATITQGAAIAVSESRERTDTVDSSGRMISYSGLKGDKLAIRAAEPLGNALSNVFMENVNRPYTGVINKDEEISIFLFEDIVNQ